MIKQPVIHNDLKPKLIPSIMSGFEIVANRPWLIILPILLDLFLWFGPHIRMKNLISPIIEDYKIPASLQNTDFTRVFSATRELYLVLAERFNLFSGFRTLPLGIPSLVSGTSPNANPIGYPIIWEAGSLSSAFLIWLVISLAGLIACSFYFNAISRATARDNAESTPGTIGWQTLQLLYLALLSLAFLLILVFPAMTLVTMVTLVAPALGQIALFIVGLFFIWMITPMLFTPQVIFMHHQPVLKALLSSIRMVRFGLPSTGMFFIILIILSQGLNILWQVPAENSWLTLVGIGGHALVNTSLIAAIFIYYRDAYKWVQTIILQNNLAQTSPGAR
ncbi:MAG: hypothetical protein C0391_02885 [Anaerolinea sp.]|nr:hypothetical protein [Anaerolinea sp.]